MAKVTWRKLGPDDPIFKGGLQIFKPAPKPSTNSTSPKTAGTKPHPNEANLLKQSSINEQPSASRDRALDSDPKPANARGIVDLAGDPWACWATCRG